MARLIKMGTRKYTRVSAIDEKGAGNANHKYSISTVEEPSDILQSITFQEGPVKENGVNGCTNEDLIVTVIDRLLGFQGGVYRCRENALAITKLEEALLWLNKRTQEREDRGVEGTHTV